MGGANFVACIGIALLTGACGTLSQFTNPAISSDHLDEAPPELNKLKLVSGDRRLMRIVAKDAPRAYQPVATNRRGQQIPFFDYLVCAETQADAISARGAKGSVTVEKEGAFSDETTETLMLTNTRSEVSDLVRQLGWQFCNARLNGDLTKDEYRDALKSLTSNSFAAVNARTAAEQSAKAAAEAAKRAEAAAETARAEAAKAAASGKKTQ